MEKVVKKFESWQAADEADLDYYTQLSGNEKLEILLELILPQNPDEAVIQRTVKKYPLGQGEKASQ